MESSRADAKSIPFVVYPNSGEVYDVAEGWTGLEHCTPLEHYIPEWVSLGVKIVGGCCRTYARDVGKIRKAVYNLNLK